METEKQQQLIDGLVSDLKAEVTRIEKKIATTENKYGDYMALISGAAKNEGTAKFIALALIQAGANKQGVQSAMQILYL